jgi:hypothetical protein
MALQGSLHEFALWEIVQLLSSQKKTGRLLLRNNTEQVPVYFLDGRIAGCREPGLAPNDPLMRFLRRVRWLSEEQLRGIESLNAESGRDLVDLLINGRYVDSDELQSLYERLVLDLLFRMLRWENGEYSFSAVVPPESACRISLSTDSVLMEAARRVDEHKRQLQQLPDGHLILGLRELPDPDAPLSDEEKELFGLVDGKRTLAEIVQEAPLTDYEAMEGLARLLESRWIEIVGKREVGGEAPPPPTEPARPVSRTKEIVLTGLLAGVAVLLLVLTTPLRAPVPGSGLSPDRDFDQRSRWKDVQMAIEVYHAEKGAYPPALDDLVSTEWLRSNQLRFDGYDLHYQRADDGSSYTLTAVAKK